MNSEYDLPSELEERGLLEKDGDTGKTEPAGETVDKLTGLSDDYDAAGKENIMYLGDGKNVYRIEVREGEKNVEGAVETDARCIGVVDPGTYNRIVKEEGFNGVLEYLDGTHRKALGFRNGRFFYSWEENSVDMKKADETMFDRSMHELLER